MKLGIFGTGYVGLVAATCFADAGNQVIGVDIDEEKVRKLRDGIVPIYEPGLEEILEGSLKAGRIEFTTDRVKAVKEAQVLFIAVGTPEGEDGSADLSHVLGVATFIGQNMNEDKTVVIKSTVPVGTADKVRATIGTHTKFKFDVVSNPEFLKEGAAIEDFLRPDRVVIGHTTENAKTIMTELYAPFVKNGKPVLFMSNRAAEMCKYAANAFLATKISFINELALLCDAVGADVEDVKRGFTSDSRINPAFFYPGVGYGGSCFPKDVKALVKTGELHGVPMSIVRATDMANDNQKLVLMNRVQKHYGSLKGLRLAIWGLAFKPRTDDVREAPSFALIENLLKAGAQVQAFDPVATENAVKEFGTRVSFAKDAYGALEGVDGLLIVTEWNEFRSPDFAKMKSLMKKPVIFDGRNIFSPEKIRSLGFEYQCIGRNAR